MEYPHNFVQGTDSIFCSKCGKIPGQSGCAYPDRGTNSTGERNGVLVSPGSGTSSSSGSSNSGSSGNELVQVSAKKTSGEIEIFDQDNRAFTAYMSKAQVAEQMEKLRFALRACAEPRLAALGAGDRKFSLDPKAYYSHMLHYLSRISKLSAAEKLVWEPSEQLETMMAAQVMKDEDKYARFLEGRVDLHEPSELNIFDFNARECEIEFSTDTSDRESMKVKTPAFRLKVAAALEDFESIHEANMGSNAYAGVTLTVRKALKGTLLASTPNALIWFALQDCWTTIVKGVRERQASSTTEGLVGPTQVAKFYKENFDNIPWEKLDQSAWERILDTQWLRINFAKQRKSGKRSAEVAGLESPAQDKAVSGKGTSKVTPKEPSSPGRAKRDLAKKQTLKFCPWYLAEYLGVQKNGKTATCYKSDTCQRGHDIDFKKVTVSQVTRSLEEMPQNERQSLGHGVFADLVASVKASKGKFN